MALEGRLRDLALSEVLQLLSLGRKSGVLHCHAPLLGQRSQIAFDMGVIVDAEVVGVDRINDLALPRGPERDRAAMEAAVQDVLLWRDGTFRFAPGERALYPSPVRVPVEPLLMEAAVRAEVWQRLEHRVPHARVIPAFVEVDPQQLPLLRLTPPQWELLTRVDGKRDLTALAGAMQRGVTDVAQLVYDLIGAGLLSLREGQAAPRRNPTPPAMAAIATTRPAASPPDGVRVLPDPEDDSLLDPVAQGLITPEGLPVVMVDQRATPPVAPAPVEPSFSQEQPEAGMTVPTADGIGGVLGQQGDELARAGDLVGAMAYWNAALRAAEPPPNADRVREAVALAARLHALLSA